MNEYEETIEELEILLNAFAGLPAGQNTLRKAIILLKIGIDQQETLDSFEDRLKKINECLKAM